MSALLSKADIRQCERHVRFGPIANKGDGSHLPPPDFFAFCRYSLALLLRPVVSSFLMSSGDRRLVYLPSFTAALEKICALMENSVKDANRDRTILFIVGILDQGKQTCSRWVSLN